MTSSNSEENYQSFVLSLAVSTAKTIKYKLFSRPSETSISTFKVGPLQFHIFLASNQEL